MNLNEVEVMTMTEIDRSERVKAILATVKYYRLTGRPLGVTGEVGEMEVASLLRTDAVRNRRARGGWARCPL